MNDISYGAKPVVPFIIAHASRNRRQSEMAFGLAAAPAGAGAKKPAGAAHSRGQPEDFSSGTLVILPRKLAPSRKD
jgi:hypothetical protein